MISNKLIITRIDEGILTATMENNRIAQLDLDDGSASLLGNIYVGKVENIAANINSAFVDIGGGINAYYSLTDNKEHIFADRNSSMTDRKRDLVIGDEIIVQVERDAVKTKAPVLTSNLCFTGRFLVLSAGKKQISFSSKINDASWKQEMLGLLNEHKDDDFGLIVRTNALSADTDSILKELDKLKSQYEAVLSEASFRTSKSLLYGSPPDYIASLRDTYKSSMEEIVTDDEDIYEQIRDYLTDSQPEDLAKLRLYSDPMVSLKKVYPVDKTIEEALSDRIWLDCGGYLVIEQTEAMAVVDVNTGRYSERKNIQDTFLKINLQAAKEIAFQMRLRNLSGIIIVDFIDMERPTDKEILLKALTSACESDPIKTTVVDMTRLNLVEITRKKTRRPFHEQMRKGRQK